ncbi:MAG: hypothetical protein J7K26_01595 [Candidatus Aenigmarchaeota archaeon]|nr:hypothetical protein [Candidatus Aenigmarchaeota archaeon]
MEIVGKAEHLSPPLIECDKMGFLCILKNLNEYFNDINTCISIGCNGFHEVEVIIKYFGIENNNIVGLDIGIDKEYSDRFLKEKNIVIRYGNDGDGSIKENYLFPKDIINDYSKLKWEKRKIDLIILRNPPVVTFKDYEYPEKEYYVNESLMSKILSASMYNMNNETLMLISLWNRHPVVSEKEVMEKCLDDLDFEIIYNDENKEPTISDFSTDKNDEIYTTKDNHIIIVRK